MTRDKGQSVYSRQAIKKSVRRASVNHPVTLYPIAAGVLGIVGGSLFGMPLVLGAGVGGLVLGAGFFVTNYFLCFDTLARKRMKALHEATLEKMRARPGKLQAEMAESDFARGVKQLKMARQKFDEFLDVLGRKFEMTELTYGRYSGVSETVYLSILDNLDLALAQLRSIRSIDAVYLEEQIAELRAKGAGSEEIDTLETRKRLRSTALEEVDRLLALNERAMTTLDETALKVAGIQTTKVGSIKDADLAMKELELLAARAADYEGK